SCPSLPYTTLFRSFDLARLDGDRLFPAPDDPDVRVRCTELGGRVERSVGQVTHRLGSVAERPGPATLGRMPYRSGRPLVGNAARSAGRPAPCAPRSR